LVTLLIGDDILHLRFFGKRNGVSTQAILDEICFHDLCVKLLEVPLTVEPRGIEANNFCDFLKKTFAAIPLPRPRQSALVTSMKQAIVILGVSIPVNEHDAA
jgi:hypothetical protein